MTVERRTLLGGSVTGLLAAGILPAAARAAEPAAPPAKSEGGEEGGSYGAANLGLGITTKLASFLSAMRYEQLSPEAVREAKRAVLDWLGVALAGSRQATVAKLLATYDDMGSLPVVTIYGQVSKSGVGKKLSLLDAPVVNGQMGHVLDFDDTHLGGVLLHTTTATLPALLALGEKQHSSGRDLIVALVAGFEAGIRVGRSAPAHHLGGWHLTGTLGTFAAGAGAARLLGLTPEQFTYALGIAGTQAAGMQQNRGTDCKSLHAGKAAFHGVLAANLARHGFNSSPEILEGKLGFAKIYSAKQELAAITAGLGESWLITSNGYKPYACGIVLHPLIDAMIGVSRKAKVPAGSLERAEIEVHPDVIRITGVDTPGSGLMSKFSANHAAAVAYIDQAAGTAQFSDERPNDPAVQALRKIVRVKPAPSLRLDQAVATVTAKSGETFEDRVEHATGTVANPISDRGMEDKFQANAAPVVGENGAKRIAEVVWSLDQLKDAGELAALLA